ncbi:MAG TPA: GldM family protein [Saprospiraceae bacterium]|nr:GldM family protein [Saprospiraceae bacterium]
MKPLHFVLLFTIVPLAARSQVAVSLDKVNVLYPAGAENIMTVVVSDLPDSILLLEPSLGEIKRINQGHYVWRICSRDTNTATLIIKDLRSNEVLAEKTYRVNMIPIPEPMLGSKKRHDPRPNGEFKTQGGLALVLSKFDFDLKCDIVYFDLQYITKNMDSVVKRNAGARWNSEVQELINKAKPGDIYVFYHIAYKCGCDPMVRFHSDELIFKI